jgi:hypothetical protein
MTKLAGRTQQIGGLKGGAILSHIPQNAGQESRKSGGKTKLRKNTTYLVETMI